MKPPRGPRPLEGWTRDKRPPSMAGGRCHRLVPRVRGGVTGSLAGRDLSFGWRL